MFLLFRRFSKLSVSRISKCKVSMKSKHLFVLLKHIRLLFKVKLSFWLGLRMGHCICMIWMGSLVRGLLLLIRVRDWLRLMMNFLSPSMSIQMLLLRSAQEVERTAVKY